MPWVIRVTSHIRTCSLYTDIPTYIFTWIRICELRLLRVFMFLFDSCGIKMQVVAFCKKCASASSHHRVPAANSHYLGLDGKSVPRLQKAVSAAISRERKRIFMLSCGDEP